MFDSFRCTPDGGSRGPDAQYEGGTKNRRESGVAAGWLEASRARSATIPAEEKVRNSLDSVFRPRSVAVVGASRRPDAIGTNILQNLFRANFTGMVFPVNPSASVIHSVKVWPTVSSIPDPVDLAVIVVPMPRVAGAIADCAAKGVGAAVVITAGYRETGAAGAAEEERLRETCRKHGIRLVGPNCMGVMNAEPEYSLDATFAPVGADFGTLGLASQSGAMGIAILNACRRLGIGLTQFVSMGNKADVSGNDLLEYWEDDDRTKVIGFYLESIGNVEKFKTIARRVTAKKPILMVKSGRTSAGARAASSHTGALASAEVGVSALLDQTGVLRCETLEELFDSVAALTRAPLPAGRKVGIVSNAGGPAIMAADAAEAYGLEIPTLGAETQAALRAFLPAEASTQNPVDMIASASTPSFVRTLEAVLQDPSIDAVIVTSVPPVLFDPTELMARITEVAKRSAKPVLTVFMAPEEFYDTVHRIEGHPPLYRFPESAMRALGRMCRYAEWKRRPIEAVPELADVDDDAVGRVIGRADGWIDPDAVRAVLDAYRLPIVPQQSATSERDVGAAGRAVGFPCVLKAAGKRLVHKSDVGGVVLGIRDEAALVAAVKDMRGRVAAAGRAADLEGFVVQKQLPPGREVLVGAFRDPRVGPMIGFGLGGKYVEALKDVAFRLLPLSRSEVREMMAAIRGDAILRGLRGEPPVDRDALEDIVLRIGQLMVRHPGIIELDLNPVIAYERGVRTTVADGRIRVEPPR
jgi:acetyl coenzyme A synthetase (ADP forming)-like protein